LARLTSAAAFVFLCACSSAQGLTISTARGDESRVYFATDEPLLPSDTDSSVDIYERSGGALTLATIGDPACSPGCGNGNFGVDVAGGLHLVPDGIIFSTAESLLPADTDGAIDIYRRTGGGLELVTQGTGEFDAELDSVSEDGSTVVYSTAEQLTAADLDSSVDVYKRTGGTTVLVSQGESFNGSFDAKWAVSTADGSSVFFLTPEQVLSPDTDKAIDLYQRNGTTTTLISTAVEPFNGEFDVGDRVMTSEDGKRTVFSTSEKLFETDEDEQTDIYMRFSGITTIVSDGSYNPNEGEFPVVLDALDPRANQVVMSSNQVLNEEDRDKTGPDVFEWYYDKTILVSQGPFEPYIQNPYTAEFLSYSPGGYGVVFFTSTGHLLSEDTDNSPDIYERQLGAPKQTNIYERSEGTTKLVSQGPKSFNGAFQATLQMVSPDVTRVFFTTTERLVNADTDSSVDLYERSRGAVTKLVSTGDVNGNGPYDATALGDGVRPVFATSEQLVPGDTDTAPDLYERVGLRTRLLSTAKPDPTAPTLTGSDPPSPSDVNDPSLHGTADAGSTVEIFASGECEEPAVASGTSAEFASTGLKVTVPVAADSTTSFSARAVNDEGTSGPCSSAPLAYIEDSTPGSIALTRLSPAGPANENLPRVGGTAEPEATVRVFAGGGCGGPVAGIGTGAQLGGSGIQVQVPDDSTTPITAVAIDPAGNSSACSAPLSYTEDSTAPDTTIIAGPRKPSPNRTPSFRLHTNDKSAYFICQLDSNPVKRCLVFYRVERLSLGRHRISIAAVDPAGNVDPTPATRSWKVVRPKRHRSAKRHSQQH
jgi:hypothetical protein